MDITPLIPQGRQIIQAYAGGHFRVSGQVYDGGVIVFPDRTISWPVQCGVDGLTVDHFQPLFTTPETPDVVLVGCGAAMKSMPFALRRALKDNGISVEFMDTGAACRTYNVLLAEGRRVAAALLPL